MRFLKPERTSKTRAMKAMTAMKTMKAMKAMKAERTSKASEVEGAVEGNLAIASQQSKKSGSFKY